MGTRPKRVHVSIICAIKSDEADCGFQPKCLFQFQDIGMAISGNYIASGWRGRFQMARIWKKTVMAFWKIMSWNWPVETE